MPAFNIFGQQHTSSDKIVRSVRIRLSLRHGERLVCSQIGNRSSEDPIGAADINRVADNPLNFRRLGMGRAAVSSLGKSGFAGSTESGRASIQVQVVSNSANAPQGVIGDTASRWDWSWRFDRSARNSQFYFF